MFQAFSRLVRWLRVDDPTDAVAVHFGGALLGLLAAPLAATGAALRENLAIVVDMDHDDGTYRRAVSRAWLFGVAILACLVVTLFSAVLTGTVCVALLGVGKLRTHKEQEDAGLGAPLGSRGGDAVDGVQLRDANSESDEEV